MGAGAEVCRRLVGARGGAGRSLPRGRGSRPLDPAVPYNLEEELQKRGARYGKAWLAFGSHVVEDGRLITGQNPASAAAVGEAVAKRLTEA